MIKKLVFIRKLLEKISKDLNEELPEEALLGEYFELSYKIIKNKLNP